MPQDPRTRVDTVRREADKGWYRIENKKTDAAAKVYLYDEIGMFGVSASQFVNELQGIEASKIELHLNSPGGEVFDGIAILNALRDHPAKVTAIVDGVAASSASFIAMGGDEVVMSRNSELMIHDAWGLAIGNADDMLDLAGRLNQMSDNIASIYSSKAGGTITEWRDAMRAETWYTAEEAVTAGLADRVNETNPDEVTAAKNRFNLAIFNYAGRAAAPRPKIAASAALTEEEPMPTTAGDTTVEDAAPAVDSAAPAPQTPETPHVAEITEPPTATAGGTTHQEGAGMQIDPAKLREALGLHPEASDEETRSAVVASGYASMTPFGEGGPEPARVGQPAPRKGGADPGVVQVDASILDQLRKDAAAGQEAFARLVRQERDATISAAINDGKFAPSRREHWEKAWDRDPEGSKEAIKGLARGLIPVTPAGYSSDPEGRTADDELYNLLYGTGEVLR